MIGHKGRCGTHRTKKKLYSQKWDVENIKACAPCVREKWGKSQFDIPKSLDGFSRSDALPGKKIDTVL